VLTDLLGLIVELNKLYTFIKSLACREEKLAHSYRRSKELVRVLPAVNASGKLKLKVAFVGKSKQPLFPDNAPPILIERK
jgi:hypothetical protein